MKACVWMLGACLVLGVPATSGAAPLISEIFYDAVGSDDGLGFVELWGTAGTSLDGFTLEGVNGSNGAVTHTLVLTGTIGADGFFVIGDDRGDGASDVSEVDLVLDFDFQNGPDSVVLRDEGGVRDAVGYGVFGASAVFAGEGDPAPDPAAGASLARLFSNLDRDDNALDFVTSSTPTPGFGALQPVPEPASLVLCAGGLLALAGTRQRARA